MACAAASISTEITVSKGRKPDDVRPAKPSFRPPGPAKRSITPKLDGTLWSPVARFIARLTRLDVVCQAEEEGMRMDVMSRDARSRNMAAIKGRDTKPEMVLRRALHARGLRFRLHRKDLPGRPDLVFPARRAVVFVHGCFWHRHGGCRYATTPATRVEFWLEKFAANVARDQRACRQLLALGWRVGVVWECQTRPGSVLATVDALEAWLRGDEPRFQLPALSLKLHD